MLALVCNWRAETVPAQRTPRSSALKNVVLIFLFMASFSFLVQLPVGRACRFGCDETARATRESGLNDAPTAQNVGTRMFLFVAEAAAGGLGI
jgi:hypothetical protein